MGYIKKGSTKSLGGGVSGAVILALAARSMTGATALSGARVAFCECGTSCPSTAPVNRAQ